MTSQTKTRPKLGIGKRFKNLVSKLKGKKVKNPSALAAFIGRKKFGKKKFTALSVAGRKKTVERKEGAKKIVTRRKKQTVSRRLKGSVSRRPKKMVTRRVKRTVKRR